MKTPRNKLSRRDLLAAIPILAVPGAASGEPEGQLAPESGSEGTERAGDMRVGVLNSLS